MFLPKIHNLNQSNYEKILCKPNWGLFYRINIEIVFFKCQDDEVQGTTDDGHRPEDTKER